jgi:hypothetical protein
MAAIVLQVCCERWGEQHHGSTVQAHASTAPYPVPYPALSHMFEHEHASRLPPKYLTDIFIIMFSNASLQDHPGSTVVTDSVTSDGLTKFIEARGGKHLR